RSIDVTGAAATDLGLIRLCEQAIRPQIVIEAGANEEPRVPQPQHVLQLRLILLDIEVRRNEARYRYTFAAHSFSEAAQGRGRGYDRNAFLRMPGQSNGERGEEQSETRHHDLKLKRGRERAPARASAIVSARRRPRCSSASGNGRSSRYPRSRRRGNPWRRSRGH